jgi:quinoprotein glucose dehydrogenase
MTRPRAVSPPGPFIVQSAHCALPAVLFGVGELFLKIWPITPPIVLNRLIPTTGATLAVFATCLFATLPPYPQSALSDDIRQREPVTTPASDAAQNAINGFKVPPGFEVKLWAAEPMLANVVAFEFDEQGRAFLAETHRYRTSVLDIRGYMEFLEHDIASVTLADRIKLVDTVFGEQSADLAIETELVRLVEDTDGDGMADSSKVFADGFDSKLDGIAAGVITLNGKVWFTNIPSLWQFDTDESGTTATSRQELLRGFGTRFGYTGHDFHGLAFGPDGKLYYSIGDRGTDVTTPEGYKIEVPYEGAVFRSNFDGTELEIVHTGLRNPQELAFNEYGDLFTGDNDCDNGDMERLVQIVEGGESGWRIGYQFAPLGRAGPWMSEDLWKPDFEGRAAYLLPPLANIEDGPSGITYYPGTGFDESFDQTLFMTHFKGSVATSGIQSYKLEESGAAHRVTASEQFLWGTLPTDVTFAPNGAFYFVDWVVGWPKSNQGRIYSVTPTNPSAAAAQQVAEVKALIGGGILAASDQELHQLLGHADQRVRLRAQYELADRGPASIPALEKIAADGTASRLHRIHALWTLGMIQQADQSALATLTTFLSAEDREVRAQAAKLAGDHGIEAALPALITLTQDPEARVQFFAAQSLGKLGGSGAGAALVELLRANDDEDKYLRHAAAHALYRLNPRSILRQAESDPSVAVRTGALMAYRKLQDPRAAQFLADADPFIVREAALAINDAPIEAALPALAAMLGQGDLDDDALQLRIINARHRLGRPEDAVALAAFAAQNSVPREMRQEALAQLSTWPEPFQRDRLVGVYRPLEARDAGPAIAALESQMDRLIESSSYFVKRAVLHVIRDLKITNASDRVLELLASESEDGRVRAEALTVLDDLDDSQILAAVEVAGDSNSPELRLATLPILARLSPDQALPILTRMAENGAPQEMQAAFKAIAQLDHPEAELLLTEGLQRLGVGLVPYMAQVELLDSAEASESPVVQRGYELLQQQWAESGDALISFRGALEGGDGANGWTLFNQHPVLACTRCHIANGEGGYAGPDLTGIADRMTPEEMLEAIIYPNATIAEGFDVVAFTLSDGGFEVGTIAEETAETITIYDATGTAKSFAADLVTNRAAAPSSMPAIFGMVLERSELRDLMNFMRGLTAEAGEEAAAAAARATHAE